MFNTPFQVGQWKNTNNRKNMMHMELLPRPSSSNWIDLDDEQPEMAPMDRVAEFETEVDAINYCVDQAVRNRRGLTHMQLADDMRLARAVLTKMRQGQVGVPVSKFLTFVNATKSYALLQFYALNLGLVVKTKQDENATARKIARLEAENAELRGNHTRVVGR